MLSTYSTVYIEKWSTEDKKTHTGWTEHIHPKEAMANKNKFTLVQPAKGHEKWKYFCFVLSEGQISITLCLISFCIWWAKVPWRAAWICSHNLQSLIPTTRNTWCSMKVSFSLSAFGPHPNYDLDLCLGLFNFMLPSAVKRCHQPSQILRIWEAQGSLLGCFQTFLLSQGLSSTFLCVLKQSASSSRAQYSLPSFWVEKTTFLGTSGKATMPTTYRLYAR